MREMPSKKQGLNVHPLVIIAGVCLILVGTVTTYFGKIWPLFGAGGSNPVFAIAASLLLVLAIVVCLRAVTSQGPMKSGFFYIVGWFVIGAFLHLAPASTEPMYTIALDLITPVIFGVVAYWDDWFPAQRSESME